MSGRPFSIFFVLLALLFTITATCFSQTPLHVLYVQENTNLLTYNVDRSTLEAAQMGQPLALTGNPSTVKIIPSPDDHFIYVLSGPEYTPTALSVYVTDNSGVPQAPAIQSFASVAITQFVVDPNGKFAYLEEYTTNPQGESLYDVRLFTINSSTGRLTESPQVQLKYGPSQYCLPIIAGFYPDGSKIEYDIWCTPSAISARYYERGIDPQTGEWGPAAEFFNYDDNNSDINSDTILLAPRSINDLNVHNTQPSVRVYPLTGGKTLLIDCTTAMLSACGEAQGFSQDISGQYLFLGVDGNIEIVKIDLAERQIVDTGNAVVFWPAFSPDDLIFYGEVNSDVQIDGFDPSTGEITTGGQIAVGSTLGSIYPALRQ
jgi:hypothetical protein